MELARKITVVIVEDEGLFRDMLRIALRRDESIEVIGDFASGEEALEAVPLIKPDVAILDVQLQGELNGIELGIRLRWELPQMGVVVLSNYTLPSFLGSLRLEEASGWSFLRKQSVRDIETLVRTVRGSANQLMVLDPQIVSERYPSEGGAVARLTPRQREILRLIAVGFTNSAIASKLGVAEKTVENTISSLYVDLFAGEERSNIHPRVRAVLVYLQQTASGADDSIGPALPEPLRDRRET